jgi:hypothetical protein
VVVRQRLHPLAGANVPQLHAGTAAREELAARREGNVSRVGASEGAADFLAGCQAPQLQARVTARCGQKLAVRGKEGVPHAGNVPDAVRTQSKDGPRREGLAVAVEARRRFLLRGARSRLCGGRGGEEEQDGRAQRCLQAWGHDVVSAGKAPTLKAG